MKKYTSSLDGFTIVITLCTAALGLGLGYFVYKRTDGGPMAVSLSSLAALIILGITISRFFLKTNSITLNDTGIAVDRMVKPVTISYAEIKAVSAVPQDEMTGVLRMFGNGGVFGYNGRFRNDKYGSMTWYCTQRKNYVMIEKTNGNKIVVSPDDPQALVKELALLKPALVPQS